MEELLLAIVSQITGYFFGLNKNS